MSELKSIRTPHDSQESNVFFLISTSRHVFRTRSFPHCKTTDKQAFLRGEVLKLPTYETNESLFVKICMESDSALPLGSAKITFNQLFSEKASFK